MWCRGGGLDGGSPLHREKRENDNNKIPVWENIGNLEICQNTRNLDCSSCKFPGSKGKRYFEISRVFFSLISLPSQFCVCNSHKSRKLAQGKFAVRQGKKQGKCNLSGYPVDGGPHVACQI